MKQAMERWPIQMYCNYSEVWYHKIWVWTSSQSIAKPNTQTNAKTWEIKEIVLGKIILHDVWKLNKCKFMRNVKQKVRRHASNAKGNQTEKITSAKITPHAILLRTHKTRFFFSPSVIKNHKTLVMCGKILEWDAKHHTRTHTQSPKQNM